MFSTFLLLPALLAAPVDAADVAESEDGVFEMVLPEDWWLDGDVVRHAKDPFEVRLRDTWPVAPDGYKAQLTAIAKDAEAGATSGSWAGGVRDSRRGACIDTRGTVGFNVRIATWCLVQLDDDHAALLTMHTRNMLHGTTYGLNEGDHRAENIRVDKGAYQFDWIGCLHAAPSGQHLRHHRTPITAMFCSFQQRRD